MAVEQMKSEDYDLYGSLAEVAASNSSNLDFGNSEKLIGDISFDPENIKISDYVESFNKETMKIKFKEGVGYKEKANTIMVLLARKNKEFAENEKNNLGGEINLIKNQNTGLYYLKSSKGQLGIQPNFLQGLTYMKQFDFYIQSSIIGGLEKKNKKRTITINEDGFNFSKF